MKNNQQGTQSSCPSCTTKGKNVKPITIESLVKPDASAKLSSIEGFRFCAKVDCDVAYFNADTGEVVKQNEVTVRIGQKETDPSRTVCYCFDHTVEEIEAEIATNGSTAVYDEIKTKCAQGLDRCAVTNPQGVCCLGNVSAVIKEGQNKLCMSLRGDESITGDDSTKLITMASKITLPSGKPTDVLRHRTGWKSSLATLPAIAFAFLPKIACPACWPAYGGFLSSLGLGFLVETKYMLPMTALFLFIAVGALAFRARNRHGLAPFCVGLLSAAIILAGKFKFESDTTMYGGITLLVCASIWNTWPRKKELGCPSCVS